LLLRFFNSCLPTSNTSEQDSFEYFRLIVTPFYLRIFHNVEHSIGDLLNFNPLESLSDPAVLKVIDTLSEIFVNGSKSLLVQKLNKEAKMNDSAIQMAG